MPIRVSCRHCGKQFSAWEDLVGKLVQCPKCKSQMIVPGGATPPGENHAPGQPAEAAPPAGSDLASLDEVVDELPSLDEMVSELRSPDAPAADLPSLDHMIGDLPVEAPPVVSQQPSPPAAARAPMPPAVGRSKPRLASAPAAEPAGDYDDSEDLPIVCPNCNQPVPGGDEFCDACGYHRILKKVLDRDGVRRPDKSTGFERVLKQQLHPGETAESALFWAKIVGGLILLVIVLLCLGRVAALLCLMGLAALAAWMFLRRRNEAQSSLNRDPISGAVWIVLLTLQRAFGWRLLEWPLPQTKVLTIHDPGFTDDDLRQFENLPTYQTLDLEGTQISNDGLVHLETLKQLRYLVLLRTQVTTGGVQRLQGKLDQVMIWY